MLLLIGAISIAIDLWQDGVIVVKGVPVLTTLGAALIAVTLSWVLGWRSQEAWHEKRQTEEASRS